jgi:hypothetical protein
MAYEVTVFRACFVAVGVTEKGFQIEARESICQKEYFVL